METKKQSYRMRELAFGFGFAIAAKTIYAPFSFLQIRLQCYDDLYRNKKIDQAYKGIKDAVKKIKSNQGISGFWKGNISAIVGKGVNNSFIIAYRDMVTEGISSNQGSKINNKQIVSNFMTPLVTLIPVILTYPLEYGRTRLINNGLISGKNPDFKGYQDLFRKTWAVEGVQGMYRGLVASLLRMGIHRTTYFGLYDSIRYSKIDMGFTQQFLIINMVTCVAALLSYPFDTARRRMMMTSLEEEQYKGLRDFFNKTLTKGSPWKIYKGLNIYFLKQFLASFSILLYDRYGAPSNSPKL